MKNVFVQTFPALQLVPVNTKALTHS